LRQRGFANTKLSSERDNQRGRDRAAKLLTPMSELTLGDLEVTPVGARRNEVPVS
jgi:hypothetical protein